MMMTWKIDRWIMMFFTLNRRLGFFFPLYFLWISDCRNWMQCLVLVLYTACHCTLQIGFKIIGNEIIVKIPIKNAFAHCTQWPTCHWMNFKLKPHRLPSIQFIDQSIRNQKSVYIPGYYRKRIRVNGTKRNIYESQNKNAREFGFNETNYYNGKNPNLNWKNGFGFIQLSDWSPLKKQTTTTTTLYVCVTVCAAFNFDFMECCIWSRTIFREFFVFEQYNFLYTEYRKVTQPKMRMLNA